MGKKKFDYDEAFGYMLFFAVDVIIIIIFILAILGKL